MRPFSTALLFLALAAAYALVFFAAREWLDVSVNGALLVLCVGGLMRSRTPGAVKVATEIWAGFVLVLASFTLGALVRTVYAGAPGGMVQDLGLAALCTVGLAVLFRACLRSRDAAREPVAVSDASRR